MIKKIAVLAAVSTFALGSAAFAQGSTNEKENAKSNRPAAEMKKDQHGGAPSMKGTTGSGSATTTADPRDSNAPAKASDKARVEDAQQKQ